MEYKLNYILAYISKNININKVVSMITEAQWKEFIILYISSSPKAREQAKTKVDPELVDVMEFMDRWLEEREQAKQ